MFRVFIACRLPDFVQQQANDVEKQVRRALRGHSRIRWTKSAGRHLTLAFLGNIAESFIPKLQDSLLPIAQNQAPIDIQLHQLGAFPQLRRARALWLGVVDPSGQLTLLANNLRAQLGHLGIPLEDRPFRPHLTLGRIADKNGADLSVLEDLALGPPVDLRLCDFELLRSHLHSSGANYSHLHRFILGSGD